MAISTSNLIHTTVQRFLEGQSLVKDSWREVFVEDKTDDGSLRRASVESVVMPATWDGTSDMTGGQIVAPDSTGATTLAYQAYVQTIDIPKYTAKDVPGITGMLAQAQGMGVASRYSTAAWALFGNAFASETVADTKALCATDHTTATTTRSNKVTTALDRAALDTVRQMAREWVNYSDVIMDLADYDAVLVVPAELEATARQILGSSVTSGQMQANQWAGYPIKLVVSPYLTDANDWFYVLEPKYGAALNPLIFWERSAPSFQVITDQDNLKTRLIVDFACVADAGPEPTGIFGAAVS
jgi:hypothetical protein